VSELSAAPYNRFDEFLSLGADRFSVLCSVLEENRLPYSVLETAAGNTTCRHVTLAPAGNVAGKAAGGLGGGSLAAAGSPPRLIFTAHYDRAPDSPGANDNGAAVFMLIETAIKLRDASAKSGAAPAIIFTDHEELQPGQRVTEQGAYGLGLHLKEKGAQESGIFVFDVCGAGDTLIISTAADQMLKQAAAFAGTSLAAISPAPNLARRVQQLRAAALEAARSSRLENVLLLPTPFSDDAGFLAAGLCAQTITVLPGREAADYSQFVRARPEAAAALFSAEAAVAAQADRRHIPDTWRSLNGKGDSRLRLTPENWKRVVAFALALSS
jgi:hypothetical protein